MKRSLLIVLLALLVPAAFFAGLWFNHSSSKNSNASGRKLLYYVDPMHPAYKSDKPGIAPDCGMDLEPVYEGDSLASGDAGATSSAMLQISASQQQLIGVRTEEVSNTNSATHRLTFLGRVTPDEARVYRLVSATEGTILSAGNQSTGTIVKAEEKLAAYSSVDLITAEQAFVQSIYRDPTNRSDYSKDGEWRNQTVKLAATRLRTLGVSESQIKELANTQKVSEQVHVISPVDGVILARGVSAGQRFDKGVEFYRIADLSKVWILADVSEEDAKKFRPGTSATIVLSGQNKKLTAHVSSALPQVDPVTRRTKLRLEANNPGFVLRPDMFVSVELPVSVATGLTVPVDAVIDSGTEQRVFVDRGNGAFEQRGIMTGWRTSDRVQVLKGLSAGERVVVAGSFLLDSEARLKNVSTTPAEQPKMQKHAASEHAMKMSESEVDPSCGMNVDTMEAKSAGLTHTHEGKTYYFCSKGCRDKFQKDPATYLAKRAGR